MSPFYPKFRLWYATTLALFTVLIGLFCYWNIDRAGGINWIVFAMQILPLIALLPSLLSRYYRAFSWLCFIILFYFVNAVMASFSSIATLLDYIFLFCTFFIFISSMLCGRYAQRIQKGL